MPDFNEDIVKAYFELNGYFVRTNVPYQPGERGDESDIDIIAVHPVKEDFVACEVKGWHNERLTMSYWKDWPLLNFTSERATKAVRQLVGDLPFRHLLVVPPLGTRQRDEIIDYASEHGVELLEWPTLLNQMAGLVQARKNARNPTDHLLRVLTVYGFLSRSENA
jgi:hypothetical protein